MAATVDDPVSHLDLGRCGSLIVRSNLLIVSFSSAAHMSFPQQTLSPLARAYRAVEGGKRACNVHRRQNAECY